MAWPRKGGSSVPLFPAIFLKTEQCSQRWTRTEDTLDRLFRIDFYPQDWLIDTAQLTPDQRGIFIQIVCLIYANRGPIKNDPNWIGRASNCSTRMAKTLIDQLAEAGFVRISDGKIGQKRAENELKTKRTHLERSSNGGRTAAENRAQSPENNDLGSSGSDFPVGTTSPTPSPTAKESKNNKDPDTGGAGGDLDLLGDPAPASGKQKKPAKGSNLPAAPSADETFETFWAGWRPFDMDKGGKAPAKKAYTRALVDGATPEDILAKRDEYLNSCHSRQCRTKHASSWLNQKGFEDNYGGNNGPASGAHKKPKTSYLDKVQAAGKRALEQLRNDDQLDAGHSGILAGWQGEDPRGAPKALPLPDRDRQEIPDADADPCGIPAGEGITGPDRS
ncbi:MAG: DUF1376 domain-containing protein [Desulfurellales bacterium]|nr:MAG: DUF1376 domain-containing protein [Desulfurellales bacterium]